MPVTSPPIMTREETDRFREQGFAGPFTAMSPSAMALVRERLETEVLDHNGLGGNPHQSRHLDSPLVWELCSNPEIVERMAAIYGPDLILWRSHFFNKGPGSLEIPWHQDHNYWPIEPAVNITAWLAIDAATEENSCVQFIPGTHKKIVPHIEASPGMAFNEMADPAFFDTSKAINMILQPGEFVLFNEKTLHHSEPNRSDKQRHGLAVRVTIPIVKVDHDQLFADHTCVLLRGEDRMRLNRMSAGLKPAGR